MTRRRIRHAGWDLALGAREALARDRAVAGGLYHAVLSTAQRAIYR